MRPSLHSIARRLLHRTQHHTVARLTRCIQHQAPLQRQMLGAMPSRSFSSTNSTINNTSKSIPEDRPFEEETNPGYNAGRFYPVRIGEVFKSRYEVLAKLGFGMCSTVWLCRDQESQSLLALKICTSNRTSQEVQIAHHLQSLDTDLEDGLSCLRIPLDDFEVSTASGNKHTVMVFTPLDLTWNQIRKQYKAAGVGMPKAQIQYGLCLLLCGLNILHEAGIVHTDLYPNNIMFAIANKSTWSRIAQSEKETPSPRKVLSDRSIYKSHDIPDAQCVPPPIIADFGHARMGELGQKYRGRIMPDFYRAPEVILGMEWDCKVDMWSVGLMIWDLFEGSRLFHAVKDGRLSDELHLAEMIALMGPPPKAFLDRSEECSKYWDAEGNWIASTPIPDQTFESLEVRLEGEDKELLLAFARKVLRWLPEERKSAGEFLEEGDDFLTQWGVTEAEL